MFVELQQLLRSSKYLRPDQRNSFGLFPMPDQIDMILNEGYNQFTWIKESVNVDECLFCLEDIDRTQWSRSVKAIFSLGRLDIV